MLVVILIVLSFTVAYALGNRGLLSTENEVTSEHYQEDTQQRYRFDLAQQQVTPIPEQSILNHKLKVSL